MTLQSRRVAGIGTALIALGAARFFVRHSRYINLRGKVAVITGGSRGLGLLMARELLQQGCRVTICARSNDELTAAERDLSQFGTQIHAVPCDLLTEQGCRELIDAVQKRWGTIDILVNNAGVIVSGPQDTMDAGDYDELMRIHFWAPYHLTMAALPEMRKNGGGRIVNISSIGGKVPVPHLLPYTASKFALRGFSEGLGAELAKENIFVTTVCPGLMRTGSQINAYFKGDYAAEYGLFRGISAVPGISVEASKAMRKIIDAMQHGDAEVVIGAAAKIADTVYAIAPNMVSAAFTAIDRILPRGENEARLKGRDIPIPPKLRVITGNIDAAAAQNNER